MTRAAVHAAAAAVRAWTWLYTWPLDPVDADSRRREIESDLWEFAADVTRGAPSPAVATHLLARLLLGVPDDLLWACERVISPERRARPASVVRIAAVAIAAATVVVSASGPTIDPVGNLRVNVESVGWLPVTIPGAPRRAFEPAIVFTLTNAGTDATSALQVNAIFHRPEDDSRDLGLGTAFAPVVGWRGLQSAATSARVVLHGPPTCRVAVPPDRLDAANVRLFVQHEGRWTVLGDFRIPARPMPR